MSRELRLGDKVRMPLMKWTRRYGRIGEIVHIVRQNGKPVIYNVRSVTHNVMFGGYKASSLERIS